jgi:hypothetical protein
LWLRTIVTHPPPPTVRELDDEPMAEAEVPVSDEVPVDDDVGDGEEASEEGGEPGL